MRTHHILLASLLLLLVAVGRSNGQEAGYALLMPPAAIVQTNSTGNGTDTSNNNNGRGTAIVILNKAGGYIEYAITVANLTGPVTEAHFHGPAAVGFNADAEQLFALDALVNNLTASGFLLNVTDEQFEWFRSGKVYLSVHTANDEIRGQVEVDPLIGVGYLNGAKNVPALASTAAGTIAVRLIDNATSLWYAMTVSEGFTGDITGARFHGPADFNSTAPVLFSIPSLNNNNRHVQGKQQNISADWLTFLRDGLMYVDVTTTDDPEGEIRSQIEGVFPEGEVVKPNADFLYGYALLMPLLNIVPSGNATTGNSTTGNSTDNNALIGRGTAIVILNEAANTIEYSVTVANLTGPVTQAFFRGPAGIGQIAEPVFSIDSLANTLWAAGFLRDVTPQQFELFKAGKMYLSVHTDQNPDGELRGQVLVDPLIGVGYLAGVKSVPPLSSNAFGTIAVRLVDNATNLWYAMTVSEGFSSDIIASHFHGPADSNSTAGVLQDILGLSNSQRHVEGKWMNLTEEWKQFLRDGLIYVNVHTVNNPDGEIRSQIEANFPTSNVTRPSDILYGYALLAPLNVGNSSNGGGNSGDNGGNSTNGGGNNNNNSTSTIVGGRGTAIVILNELEGTIEYAITVANLSGPITQAFFRATLGNQNTDALFSLDDLVGKLWANEILTNVTAAQFALFKGGNVNLTVHTSRNPSGELRGQVLVDPTVGVAFLSGSKALPPVLSPAAGTLAVRMVDNNANLFYSLTVSDDFASDITGARFHGPADFNSTAPVLFSIPGLNNNNRYAEGKWTNLGTDEKSFLRDGLMYVDVATASNPEGEIRSQIEGAFGEF